MNMPSSYKIKRKKGKSTDLVHCNYKRKSRSVKQDGAQRYMLTSYANEYATSTIPERRI